MEQAIPGLTAQTLAAVGTLPTGFYSSPLTSNPQEKLKKEMDLPAFYLHTSGSTGKSKSSSF